MATTAAKISVDGDEHQRREVAGGEKTIRRPEDAEQVMRGRKVLEIFQNLTRRYI